MDIIIDDDGKEQENQVNSRFNVVLDRMITERYGTKQAFADKLGVTRSLVSLIVHGHKEACTETKIKMAKELGVDSRTLWPIESK